MTRQWRIHRELIAHPDGQRRWDRAYQHLLRWGQMSETDLTVPTAKSPLNPQEVEDAGSRVRPGLDQPPGADPND